MKSMNKPKELVIRPEVVEDFEPWMLATRNRRKPRQQPQEKTGKKEKGESEQKMQDPSGSRFTVLEEDTEEGTEDKNEPEKVGGGSTGKDMETNNEKGKDEENGKENSSNEKGKEKQAASQNKEGRKNNDNTGNEQNRNPTRNQLRRAVKQKQR
ncbi:unnamed protein product [Linum trigynum]|uniref:Uncharacterized protein n=1 Tax=Linum trigynum TaxID=586398 RepID=A0AAV2DEE9_9ROSI